MSWKDSELAAINKVMTILASMTPIVRARVLDYVISRAESLGMPPPKPERPADAEDMFGELEDRVDPADRLVPRRVS